MLKSSLLEGVEIVIIYDCSQFIDCVIDNFSGKLLEEFIVVVVVCVLFFWYVCLVLVVIILLLLGLCIVFIVMYFQGLNVNIMLLGGIVIVVGVMVDAVIVMIENVYKWLEEWQYQYFDVMLDNKMCWQVIIDVFVEVGLVLFISLLIIMLLFILIFILEGQEGCLFGLLVFIKMYVMVGAVLLVIVVILILMGYWICGKILLESSNLFNCFLICVYYLLLLKVLYWLKIMLLVAVFLVLMVFWLFNKVGGEFLLQINEGDLLYMLLMLLGIFAAEAVSML